MKTTRTISSFVLALIFIGNQLCHACPSDCLAPSSSFSSHSPLKNIAKEVRTLKSITRGLDEREKDFLSTYLAHIETVRWGIDRYFAEGNPDRAGELALAALERGIPSVTGEDVQNAIEACIAKGLVVEAARLATSFFNAYITTMPSADVQRLLRAFEPWPDKYGALVVQAVNAHVKGVSSREALKALRRLFEENQQAWTLAVDSIKSDAAGLDVEDVCALIDTCIKKKWEYQASILSVEAIRKYRGKLRASDVRSWVEMCSNGGWQEESKDIVVAAIECDVPDISTADVREWIARYRFESPVLAGKIASAAAVKQKYGVTVTDLYALLNQCKRQDWGTAIGDILSYAVRVDVPGLTAADIRSWIDLCLNYNWPRAAGAVAVAVIDKKFPGITPQDIDSWMAMCRQQSPYDAGLIALAGLTNHVEGLTFDSFRLATTMCFAQDGLEQEGIRLAIGALEQGVTGITSDDINNWMAASLRSVNFERAADIASLALRRHIPGILPSSVRAWTSQCVEHDRLWSGIRIALAAIESKSSLVSDEEADDWIKRSVSEGSWNYAGLFSMALIDVDRCTELSKNPGLVAATDEAIRFMKKHQLGRVAFNPFATRKMMDLDLEDFAHSEELLAELSAVFHATNGMVEKGRRVDEKMFRSEYAAQAFIMELIVPGSIPYMVGLLKQSAKPQSVIRFLDTKKKALLDERVTGAVTDLQKRIRERERLDRRKVKIEVSAVFKLLDLCNSFVELNRAGTVVQQVRTFDVSQKISDLTNALGIALLVDMAKTLGIGNSMINPDAYAKIYIPFLPRLFQAMDYMRSHNADKVERFTGLVKAMLEDKTREYIENETQPDETGRAIAAHNKHIREQLRLVGIDPAKWLGWEKQDRLTPAECIYYEKADLPYDSVNDANTVVEYVKRVLNMPELKSGHQKMLVDSLKMAGIVVEYSPEGAVTRLIRDKKDTKKGDLIACVADKENLDLLSKVSQVILASQDVMGDRAARETVVHFGERVRTLAHRLQDVAYKSGLSRQRRYFTIRQFLRDPGHDLFMGDFTNCCLAMNSGQYPDAMVDRLIDEGTSVVEVLDDATGKTVACLWLYVAEDGSLVVQNIEINAEYEREKPLMDALGDEMVSYAAQLARHIGAPRLVIGMPGHGKYFGTNGYVEQRYTNKIVPYGKEKIGGYFGEKYYLDTAGKPYAYLAAVFVGSAERTAQAAPALFPRDKLMGKQDTPVSLWRELTAMNGGDEPAVVYLTGNDAAIKEQFDGQIKGVPGDRLVYLSIEQRTVEADKLGNDAARAVTRHIVLVARAADLKDTIRNILNGIVWSGKYQFMLYIGEYGEMKNIHVFLVSLEKKLRGRGFMGELYQNIGRALKSNFPAGYSVTVNAEALGPMLTFFRTQGFEPRIADADALRLVMSYEGAFIKKDNVFIGAVHPVVPGAASGADALMGPMPSLGVPGQSLDLFIGADKLIVSDA